MKCRGISRPASLNTVSLLKISSSWPTLLIEKHYPWQYPLGTKKERDFKYEILPGD
jgi:hypothetical protein